MQVSRRAVMLGGLGLAAGSSVSRAARAAPPSQESAVAAAVDAYIYGYPLVLLDVTRRQLTNVATAGGSRAPMGQLLRLRSYPAVDDHSVAAPNADTLYTYAWLDLGKEPMVVSIPDMADRYFMMPMLSGWSDVFQSPGTRTTGQRPQTYAITGPRWSGRFPAGVTECRSPTDIVWLLGRIYCTGTAEDYAKVHALQDAMSLAPLSHYGKSYRPLPSRIDPSVDMRTPPVQQVNALGVREYFSHLAKLMKTNPPQPGDSAIVEQMASIGLARGKGFDPSKLSATDRTALESIPKLAQQHMFERFKSKVPINGWLYFGPSVANWGHGLPAPSHGEHARTRLEHPCRRGLSRFRGGTRREGLRWHQEVRGAFREGSDAAPDRPWRRCSTRRTSAVSSGARDRRPTNTSTPL